MAHSDDHKKFVTIDNVRISYKPKDDTIHLTSTDPDVQAGGFHLSLSKGTQTETTLRDLLVEHEVIKTILPKINVAETAPKLDLNKKGSILTVTSTKGGVGKTALSLLLGTVLNDALNELKGTKSGQKDLRVCVVDMDIRGGQIGYILEQTTPTALNIFTSSDRTPESIKSNLIYDEHLGIWSLLAPKRAITAAYLNADFYEEVIERLREMFDVVILDTTSNHLDPLFNKVAFPLSDVILLVTNCSAGSLHGIDRWMHEIKKINPVILTKTVKVFNKIHEDFDINTFANLLPELPIAGTIPQEISVDKGYNTNALHTVIKKSNKASKALKELVKNITSI